MIYTINFLGEFSMQNYLEFIGNELKALTSIPSPSGYTKDVAAYLMKTLSDMGYEPQLSNKGNVFVTIGGEGNPLVLAAHVDTLGAMVRLSKPMEDCVRLLSVDTSGVPLMGKTARSTHATDAFIPV